LPPVNPEHFFNDMQDRRLDELLAPSMEHFSLMCTITNVAWAAKEVSDIIFDNNEFFNLG